MIVLNVPEFRVSELLCLSLYLLILFNFVSEFLSFFFQGLVKFLVEEFVKLSVFNVDELNELCIKQGHQDG